MWEKYGFGLGAVASMVYPVSEKHKPTCKVSLVESGRRQKHFIENKYGQNIDLVVNGYRQHGWSVKRPQPAWRGWETTTGSMTWVGNDHRQHDVGGKRPQPAWRGWKTTAGSMPTDGRQVLPPGGVTTTGDVIATTASRDLLA